MFMRWVTDLAMLGFNWFRDLGCLNLYMVLLPILLDRLAFYTSWSYFFFRQNVHYNSIVFCIQDKANPFATVLSAAMLLKYGLGEEKAAERIENAVLDTLNRGFRTADIYSAGLVSMSFSLLALISKGFYVALNGLGSHMLWLFSLLTSSVCDISTCLSTFLASPLCCVWRYLNYLTENFLVWIRRDYISKFLS